MATFRVVDKVSKIEAYRYSADSIVEWSQFPSSEFNTELVEEVVLVSPDYVEHKVSKLEFVSRLGDAAFEKILELAKSQIAIDAWVQKFYLTSTENDGRSIDLNDPRTIAGVHALEPVMIALGVVAPGWAEEVLA